MTKTRRKFTAEQKAAIVRRHFRAKIPFPRSPRSYRSSPHRSINGLPWWLTKRSGRWEKTAKSQKSSQRAEAKINELIEQRIKKLEKKLVQKNEVIAELMEEKVKAKKANGDL